MYRVDTSLVSVSEFISRKPAVVVFTIQTGVSLSKELTSKPYCKYKSWAGKKDGNNWNKVGFSSFEAFDDINYLHLTFCKVLLH